jgi:hypothetical protein
MIAELGHYLRGFFKIFLLAAITIWLVACGGGGGGGGESSTGTITIDPITADDVVNAAEAAGIINVTGSVGGGIPGPGDLVDFAVNGTAYNGTVGAGSTFSIAVSGADLAADTSFRAVVTSIVTNGSQISTFLSFATSTHTVDLTARAKITVDNITVEDVVTPVVTSLPITIPGSINFDATQVDFSKVTFGPDGASPVHDGHIEDVNDDGYMDMVFHFEIQETGIVCGESEATLTGETFDGVQFMGTDEVKPIKCN